jgi:hypothetical protein
MISRGDFRMMIDNVHRIEAKARKESVGLVGHVSFIRSNRELNQLHQSYIELVQNS